MKVAIARISRGGQERVEIGTWLVACWCDPVVDPGTVLDSLDTIDAEPTPAARATAVLRCRKMGYTANDVLIMIDNDMVPDIENVGHRADNFYNRAVRFLADHPGPYVIAAPYCGGPPKRDVQVVGVDGKRVMRAEAAKKRHIEQVAGIGTGLFAANLAVYDAVEKAGNLPWFDYRYADEPMRATVSATEDMYFCEKLNAAGGKIFCDWEYWSAHSKTELVGKPKEWDK